jgi:hypothetical protein
MQIMEGEANGAKVIFPSKNAFRRQAAGRMMSLLFCVGVMRQPIVSKLMFST